MCLNFIMFFLVLFKGEVLSSIMLKIKYVLNICNLANMLENKMKMYVKNVNQKNFHIHLLKNYEVKD